jgi:hypothetical protein
MALKLFTVEPAKVITLSSKFSTLLLFIATKTQWKNKTVQGKQNAHVHNVKKSNPFLCIFFCKCFTLNF